PESRCSSLFARQIYQQREPKRAARTQGGATRTREEQREPRRAARTHQWTETSVPTGAQLYTYSACHTGMFTQPWLIWLPKLLCQYAPWNAMSGANQV